MNRDDFLARVEAAAIAGRAHRVHLRDTPGRVGFVGCGDDHCAALADEIRGVGGDAYLVESDREAREVLNGVCESLLPTTAICWQHPLLDRLDVATVLRERQITQHAFDSLGQLDPEAQRSAILAADIGISSVTFAVAETGSLVVASRPGQERVVSLLPPVHVALVDQSQIVPDLFDVFDHLQADDPQSLPSNLAFITGPSKTGDIELQLTTGVHGPGKWIVVVIRSDRGET